MFIQPVVWVPAGTVDDGGPPAWQASAPHVALKQDGPEASGGSARSVGPWQPETAQVQTPAT